MVWRPQQLDVADILEAIEDELAVTRDPVIFTVESKEQEKAIWKIRVRHDEKLLVPLDESLEGQDVWWPGPAKGAADVLSVIPEELQINLRFATAEPPDPGQQLFIYPARYLEALHALWRDSEWSNRSQQWFRQALQENLHNPADTTSPDDVPFPLRHAQKTAFKLTGWRAGFLWGPPGTGKTYTVGAIVAKLLLARPSARVLLLSTTNSATDQALIAVDTRLEEFGQVANRARRVCQRVGNHFIGGRYVGREHLLPVSDPELVAALAALEANRPDPANVSAYAGWKHETEAIRARLRERARAVLQSARLAAATTTAATFLMATLRELPPYDLVVFDEASQVGLAHALAIAPLGRHVLFAGDPEQLLPIVRSEREAPRRWLAETMFSVRREGHTSTCFLDEQSRMIDPVCAVVSGVFYGNRLKVAADAYSQPGWLEWRRKGNGRSWIPPHLWLETDIESGTWSRTYGGPIRYASSEWIIDAMPTLLDGVEQENIVVLTPFRAQRALLRKRLREAGYKGVRVSTIHRAQGTEEHTVVLDPVDGGSPFFDEMGQRLINVGISRAQARLVLLINGADMRNPTLRQLVEVVRARVQHNTSSFVPTIQTLAKDSNFPQDVIGATLRIGDRIGRLAHVGREWIEIIESTTGKTVKFKTAVVLPAFTSPTVIVRELSLEERAEIGGRGDLRRLRAIEQAAKAMQENNRQLREAVSGIYERGISSGIPSGHGLSGHGMRDSRPRLVKRPQADEAGDSIHPRSGHTGIVLKSCGPDRLGTVQAVDGRTFPFKSTDVASRSGRPVALTGARVSFDLRRGIGASFAYATNIRENRHE